MLSESESVLGDIEAGQPPLSFNEVRKHPLVRRGGGKTPDLSAVYRWAIRGVRGVRLEFLDRPAAAGGRVTTRGALLRFFARLTAESKGEPVRQAGRSPRRRRRDLQAAAKRLERAGI